ncbi:MAG: FGGY-family carbohydrate kinase [Candidatus Hodarchaeota archaeon]
MEEVKPLLFGGIDVGTTGVKVIIADEQGNIISSISQDFEFPKVSLPEGYSEQNPKIWWDELKSTLKLIIRDLEGKFLFASDIKAISVDSTSGTIIPIGRNHEPLHNALMYNDNRAINEAKKINEVSQDFYLKFKPSFALSKILWFRENKPKIFIDTYKFVHAADYLVGHLTGDFSTSDSSNTLKTGYDIINKQWPPFFEDLGINLEKLPEVVQPGQKIGEISKKCAEETGLSTATNVVAGVTDGTAGVIASGAVNPGDIFNVIGTTLVEKVVTKKLIIDKKGRIYCHQLPTGNFIPGGASNVGGEVLKKHFPNDNLKVMDRKSTEYKPSNLIIYPLARKGERLPFINPSAESFVVGKPKDKYHLFTGCLEAVAYVERWILEILKKLGAKLGTTVYSTGGGAYSNEWCQIRADILNKIIRRPMIVESAMGAAILAASYAYYKNLENATKNMVHYRDHFEPTSEMKKKYDVIYNKFREECNKRNYN